MSPQTLEHFRALSYPIELIEDREQGGYYATYPDLLGCAAQGETAEEAVTNLAEAFDSWVEARLAEGLPIAEPLPDEPSGRFLVRTTSWVHRSLTHLAQRQGVSLNLLVNNVLSEYIGGAPYRDQMTDLARALAHQLERFAIPGQGPGPAPAISNRAFILPMPALEEEVTDSSWFLGPHATSPGREAGLNLQVPPALKMGNAA